MAVVESGAAVPVDPDTRPLARPRATGPMTMLSDGDLLALVASADDRALDELYTRYGRVAYGLALRVVRDRTLAEDAVQDAFLNVWRSAAGFAPSRAKPSTWILTLVHRRAVDVVRREERRRADRFEVAEAPVGAPMDEEVAVRMQRRRVQEALNQLSDEHREALELAYYGGLTQSELAARLGLPLGTIKSRMFTGLARMRELLADVETGGAGSLPST